MGLHLRTWFLAAGVAFAALPAYAHSVYIAERLNTPTVVNGHGASDEAYDPMKVESAKAFDAKGAEVAVTINRTGKNAALAPAAGAALISVFFNEGYWTEDAKGNWSNVGKSQIADAKSAGKYLNFAVSLKSSLAAYPTPVGNPLEIVPLLDPIKLKAGAELPVQLLFEGKPLADVVIVADYVTDPDNETVKTDAEGKAIIKVRNNGLNVLNAYHGVKVTNDPDAEEHGWTASFAFTVAHDE